MEHACSGRGLSMVSSLVAEHGAPTPAAPPPTSRTIALAKGAICLPQRSPPHERGARTYVPVCLCALLGAAPAHSEAQPGTSFGYQTVQQLAAELAQKSFAASATDAIKGTENLDYDQYRQIR